MNEKAVIEMEKMLNGFMNLVDGHEKEDAERTATKCTAVLTALCNLELLNDEQRIDFEKRINYYNSNDFINQFR